MAAGTSALIGLGVTAVTTGMSFSQASKQRDIQVKAEAEAAKAMAEARKRLEINYYEGLSLQKEPYDMAREALNVSGAQSMEAAKEGDMRGVAATAGRIQMAQNEGQRKIAVEQGNELQDLAKLTATEESRLRDENVKLDKGEIAGAQLAAATAENNANQAYQQGLSGVVSGVTQIGKMMPSIHRKDINTFEGAGSQSASGATTPSATSGVMPDYISNPSGVIAPSATSIPNTEEFTKFIMQQHPLFVPKDPNNIEQEYKAAFGEDAFNKIYNAFTNK